MNDKKMRETQELYKKSVKNFLTSIEFKSKVGEMVLNYINNALEFFKEIELICSEEEFRLFIKSNAPHHLKDAFSHTVDLCLDNCFVKESVH